MSNGPVAINQRESPRAFLDEVYRSLGYEEGTLLNAAMSPDAETDEEWLDKGDWLALAHKVGAEKVFFVKNEPVLVFCVLETDSKNDPALIEQFRRVWCMARPQYLFIAMQGELQVYRLDSPPARDAEELRKRQIETVRNVREVAEKLQAFRREQIESGSLAGDKYFGGIDQRADRQLIQDLKTVRKQLLVTGLEAKYAHALIGRSIFIRYLEDRGVIDPAYFEKVAKRALHWQEKLSREPERPDLAPGNEKRRYYRVLRDKKFTYALFQQLADDFNGDMFPKDKEEEKKVHDAHLKLLHDFLLGDTDQGQPHLFLWAYDFEIIPIELISSIYEEFYHKENIYHPGINRENKRQDDVKTHYTPSVLVEYVLSNILPGERLSRKPRILDPACGSGIFLVESFRRIVRYHVQQRRGEMVSPDVLRRILREQIRGIEINEEAVHVAAFSLYLALLHYQEPPDIRTKRLPHLIYQENQLEDDDHYHVLFNKNVFALIDEERGQIEETLTLSLRYRGRTKHEKLYNSPAKMPLKLHSFDIITGNPPWGFEKGTTEEIREAQDQAKLWCEYFDWPIGYKEPSQTFIARALSLLNSGGECGLLIPTGVFLKHHERSEEFRRRWLEETTIKTVVNFTHVRHAFFNMDANAPFAFVHFVALPAPSDHWVRYWSVKKTEIVDRTQAIVLGQPDIRQVKQCDLAYSDFLWKVYWWGNHRDAELIKALHLNKTIEELAQIRGWPKPGRGFEIANGHKPSGWLRQYRVLPSKYFMRYGPIEPLILETAPDYVYRRGSSTIQSGWRLLIGQGITEAYGANGRVEARLEDRLYAFNSSIHGLNVDKAEDWERKVLIGILWSSLARYYYFMTASSWGTWHHQLHLEEAMSLPVRFPHAPELREEIVNLVNILMDWPVSWEQDPLVLRSEIEPLERKLDDAIFRLYGLSEAERDLVLDLCNVNLEFFYRHSSSYAARKVEQYPLSSQGVINDLPAERTTEQGLEGYLYAFLQIWNRELAPEGEFSWRVLRPSHVPMIAVIFTTQELGDTLPIITATDDEEWREVLKRCSEALKQPVGRRIYTDNMVRAVTDTEIYIIKSDERRLWTRSMAREDAEATLVQAMYLQEETLRETV